MASHSPLKENRHPKRKISHGREFSLSPTKKTASEILVMKQQNPHHVEVHQIGTDALSIASASQIVKENKSGFTICAWPHGLKTNQQYRSLLVLKDAYDVFFYLLQTSPEMCMFDAAKFLFCCLDHFVLRSMAQEISEGFALASEFLGKPPLPFEFCWDVNYISYKRWIESLNDGDIKINHFVVLRRAEMQLRDLLILHGYVLTSEQAIFDMWIRENAEIYYTRLRPERNAIAHLFCDLLLHEKNAHFCPIYSPLPLAKPSLISEEYELAKRAVALEALKSNISKMGNVGLLQSVAYKVIEVFFKENVEQAREVTYGDSRVLLPGKLPPSGPPYNL